MPRAPIRASGSGLADLEAGEPLDVNTGRLEDLRDRLLVVLHERLLGEHDVLVEPADPALDDLRDRRLRLALVTGDLLEDAPLLLHHVSRNILTDGVLRAHRRHL